MTVPVLIERETRHQGCGATLASREGKALPLLGAVVSGEAEDMLASFVEQERARVTGAGPRPISIRRRFIPCREAFLAV